MEIKIDALNIKECDYGESGKLVTLVSPIKGKLVAELKGVKSPKAKLKLAAMPMCYGEYILSSNGKWNTVIGCTVEDNFFDCWNDIHKYSAAQIVLEILDKTTYENLEAGEEFLRALESLTAIAYGDAPYLASCRFALRMYALAGVDVADFDIEPHIKSALNALYRSSPDDIPSLENGVTEYILLNVIQEISRFVLSSPVNAIAEACKLFKSR